MGKYQDVASDASVTRPLLDHSEGIGLSHSLYPTYGDIDPYWMAACAIDTAIRNLVVVGAAPQRIALLDNFCWCSSDDPERLGQLKRAARACYDFAVRLRHALHIGQDSMYNGHQFRVFNAYLLRARARTRARKRKANIQGLQRMAKPTSAGA